MSGLAVMAAEWYSWEDPLAMGFWGFFNLNQERKLKLLETPKTYEEITFHATRKRSTHPENLITHSKNSVDATTPRWTRRWKAVIRGAEGPDILSRYLLRPEKFPNTWKREQAEWQQTVWFCLFPAWNLLFPKLFSVPPSSSHDNSL